MQPNSAFALADRYQAIHVSVALHRLFYLESLQTSHSDKTGNLDPTHTDIIKLIVSEISHLRSRGTDYARWLKQQIDINADAFESSFNALVHEHAHLNQEVWHRWHKLISEKGGICRYLEECATGIIKNANVESGGMAARASGDTSTDTSTCFFVGIAIAAAFGSGNLYWIAGALATGAKAGCFDD
jgi:hypothetical protein